MGEPKITVGNWLSLAGLILALVGSAAATSLYVYATKNEVTETKERCAEKHGSNQAVIQGLQIHQTYQTSEVQRVQTRLENMSGRQQADSRNIERLLERFRVEAETAPVPKAVPEAKPAPPPMAHFQ